MISAGPRKLSFFHPLVAALWTAEPEVFLFHTLLYKALHYFAWLICVIPTPGCEAGQLWLVSTVTPLLSTLPHVSPLPDDGQIHQQSINTSPCKYVHSLKAKEMCHPFQQKWRKSVPDLKSNDSVDFIMINPTQSEVAFHSRSLCQSASCIFPARSETTLRRPTRGRANLHSERLPTLKWAAVTNFW